MGAANVEPAPLIVPDPPLEPEDPDEPPLGAGALELEFELPHAATTSAAAIATAAAVICRFLKIVSFIRCAP
jgi:hypothetical protein